MDRMQGRGAGSEATQRLIARAGALKEGTQQANQTAAAGVAALGAVGRRNGYAASRLAFFRLRVGSHVAMQDMSMFYRCVTSMQEMERGHTQHFSFLTLAHPQPDQSEVAVRFEQAVVSPATQAAALRLSEAEAKRKDEIALDGQSDAELARRDTYLVFYVRDMQTALDGIRQYDSRRAKAAAEKLRVQHARAAYQNHTTRIVGAAGAVLPRVRVRSSLVIPPTRKHSMLSAIVRDPNGMHVRLIEFTRDLVLGQGGRLPMGPARSFEQGWFARPEGQVRPVVWEARLAYLVTPVLDAGEVVRFYETHFCGPEATVVRRMKRRPVDRARDAFGLKHGKEKTETLQHKPRGNRCLLPGLRTVDEETFPELLRSFTWLGNGKRSSHTCLCVLRRVDRTRSTQKKAAVHMQTQTRLHSAPNGGLGSAVATALRNVKDATSTSTPPPHQRERAHAPLSPAFGLMKTEASTPHDPGKEFLFLGLGIQVDRLEGCMEHLALAHGVWFRDGLLHHAILGRHARCKGPDGTEVELQDGTLSPPQSLKLSKQLGRTQSSAKANEGGIAGTIRGEALTLSDAVTTTMELDGIRRVARPDGRDEYTRGRGRRGRRGRSYRRPNVTRRLHRSEMRVFETHMSSGSEDEATEEQESGTEAKSTVPSRPAKGVSRPSPRRSAHLVTGDGVKVVSSMFAFA